jgi:hypothetical protein
LEGERPDILLGQDRILLHCTRAGGADAGVELHGYDFEGCRRWSRPGWTCLLSLPEDRFLVNTPEGSPLVIDGDGQVLYRWERCGVERAVLQGYTVLLASPQQVWAADLELHPLWRTAWPESSRPVIDCLVVGAF